MAEVTEKIVSIRAQVEGANTIKELKESISQLSNTLKTTDSTAENYKDTIDTLVEAEYKLNTTMKDGKSQLAALPGSYNDLVNKMAALKTVMKSVNDEATRSQLSTEINDLNNQLKAMDAANGVYSRNVGNYMGALSGLSLEFKNQRDELKQLKQLMEQLPTSSQAYAEAFTRAAEITHNMADQTERLKYASPDLGDQLNNVRGIASNLAAGYSAVNAAMGLFGEESEDLQKVMLKVQQAMALVQGLQGMDGLIKRTEGLSKAMGLVKVAEVESAAASTADATAKTAEGVATEGATVAQKGLNAAMKANPIGAIIAVVTALIGVFVLLKDDIIELVGGQDKLNKSTEKVKVVLSGLGNVIKQIVLGPIKLLITNVKTLVNVFRNLASGNFSGAWQAIKDGANEAAQAVKDAIDVVGNYNDGATQKATELAEDAAKKAMELEDKKKDNYIKDQEAKYGADWKYTKEGKKAYEELYKNRESLYAKDSDEYRQNERDKDIYNREYTDRRKKRAADLAKKEEENRKAEVAAIRKMYEDMFSAIKESGADLENTWDKNQAAFDLFKKNFSSVFSIGKKLTKNNIEEYSESFKEYMSTVFGNTYAETYTKSFKKMLLGAQSGVIPTQEEINELFEELQRRFDFAKNSAFLSKDKDTLQKLLDINGKSFDNQIKALQQSLTVKVFEGEALLPDDEIKALQEQMDLVNEKYDTELAFLNDFKSKVGNSLTEISEINNRIFQSEMAKETEVMEIRKKISDSIASAYDKDLAKVKATHDKSLKEEEQYYAEIAAHRWNGSLFPAELQKQADEEYNITKESLNKQLALYKTMSENLQLTYEERMNAKSEMTRVSMELSDLETNYEIENINRRIEAWQEYVNTAKSSLDGIGNILGNVSKAMEQSIQNEVDAGKMSEEEAKRKFESVKKVQTAEAYINAFGSAVGAYNSMASIPYVGPALGAAAAVAALASGIAQAESIKNTSWNGGGSSSSSRYTEVTPTQTDYNPTMIQNISGEKETTDLANAVTKAPIKTYVVESEVSAKQELATKRTNETTF